MANVITAADLDTVEGLVKWRDACAAEGACLPAQRFFTRRINEGGTLREAIHDMVKLAKTTSDDPTTWPSWAWHNLREFLAPNLRLFLLARFVTEPGQAAALYFNTDGLSAEEKAWLLSRWHSAHRDDGNALFHRMEEELENGAVVPRSGR